MTEDLIDCGPFEETPVSAISFANAYFRIFGRVPSRDEAISGSGKKYVYRGTYVCHVGSYEVRVPACAVYFAREKRGLDYARERVGLAVGSALGVGPRVLESDALRPLPDACEGDCALPLIVEEDAGVSLEDVLRDDVPVPLLASDGTWGALRLSELGDAAYGRVAHKIIFDVLAQVEALQRQGLYHRDLRSANIALRAWGPGAEGIRATLIDLEFLTGEQRGWVRCASYYDRLFGPDGLVPLDREPTLLEQDLGYLAVVTAEVLAARPALELSDEEVLSVLRSPGAPLRVGPDGVFMRRVTLRDVRAEARLAGLPTVREAYGHLSDRAVDIAERESAHAGYIDTLDRIRLGRSIEMILEQSTVERLKRAIFENYKEHRLRDGEPVEFESFDEQPEDYRISCVEQARSYCDKVRMLGYEVVDVRECDETRRVSSLSDDEIEFLAREEHHRWMEERKRAGWIYGPEKDVERKLHPCLVGWDELSDDVREYDRAPVREMLSLMESVGLAVTR